MDNSQINQKVKENWEGKNYHEIGLIVGISDDSVRKRGGRMGLPLKGKSVLYNTDAEITKKV